MEVSDFIILSRQYELAKQSREVVFSFCETISAGDYTKQVDNFGKGGTMHSLHLHCANTYLHWLGYFALNKPMHYNSPEIITTIGQVKEIYDGVDTTVAEFLETFKGRYDTPVTNVVMALRKEMTFETMALFTHSLTHEFHHKGQVMSMSRMLGYTPPDADIIR